MAQRAVLPARPRPESEVLLRQIDTHLGSLRTAGGPGRRVPPAELGQAERVADALRRLVADTALASAADRARVRAAVHCFVARGVPVRATMSTSRYGPTRWLRTERRLALPPETEYRVVADLLVELGRADLAAVMVSHASDAQAS